MPHPFDAANKHLLQAHPADWLALGGLPVGTSIEVIEAELSAVSMAADKLIRVNGPAPYVGHIEFQSGLDEELDQRVLTYNVLARRRTAMSVRSVVFMLRPQAMSPRVTGRVLDAFDSDHRLDFAYKLIRVWGIKPDVLLTGGLGTVPLAPISAVAEPDLPAIIDAMFRRFDREVAPEEAGELWTATRILMGLRWPGALVGQLLKGVQRMKESVTYQEIVEEGIEQGIERGIERGRVREARSLVLRRGRQKFGEPSPAIEARINAIENLQELEGIFDRVLDGPAHTWSELFRPIT